MVLVLKLSFTVIGCLGPAWLMISDFENCVDSKIEPVEQKPEFHNAQVESS